MCNIVDSCTSKTTLSTMQTMNTMQDMSTIHKMITLDTMCKSQYSKKKHNTNNIFWPRQTIDTRLQYKAMQQYKQCC